MKLFCRNYQQSPSITTVVHYFCYNSHYHYHFHYQCKMHPYCLKVLVTIPLGNMIPCCFSKMLPSFHWHMCFSSLIPSFSFIAPSWETQKWFTTIRDILDVLFILIFIFTQKQLFTSILHNRCSLKFRKFHRKTPVLEWGLKLYLNKSLTRMFSCEISETSKIFKNTFFTDYFRWLLLFIFRYWHLLTYTYLQLLIYTYLYLIIWTW